MKCKWIIENFTDSEDYRDLISAVKESGRYCFAIDKRNHFDFDPSGFNENDCVIVQGSIQMTKHINEKLPKGCFPVAYSNWNNYLCSTYYPEFKTLLFNDFNEFTTLKNLKENRFHFYEKFGKEALIFIRPDSGEKTFQAQLLDLQDFDRFWANGIQSGVKDDDLIVVSTPKKITGEFRFVCSKYGGEIIASSTYQYQGQRTLIPSVPNEARSKCEEILKSYWYPDSIFCVDIFQDSDMLHYLGELTSFSSAGLYATNKKDIVKRVNEIVEMEYNVNQMYNKLTM
jgi:hypothetical protein